MPRTRAASKSFGGVLYRATIAIPSQVPVGTYTAETFLIDRGKVHRRRNARHPDRQVGLRARRRAGGAAPWLPVRPRRGADVAGARVGRGGRVPAPDSKRFP